MLESVQLNKDNIKQFGAGNASTILSLIKEQEEGVDMLTYIQTTSKGRTLNVYRYDKSKWKYILNNKIKID